MSNASLRNITNNFQDVRLISLASWSLAAEISPRDHGGPYVVMQEGYDPADPRVIADEFLLGRSGQWLSTAFFYQMAVPARRAEYVFGTAAEVMTLMQSLPQKVQVVHPAGGTDAKGGPAAPEDEMAATFIRAKDHEPV